MAAFIKFGGFVGHLGLKIHDLNADTLKLYLSNTAPNTSTHVLKGDLAEIGAGNGYVAGGEDTQNTYVTSGGVGTCTGLDIVWTAAGGTIGPFRYPVLYNSTPTSGNLIGFWDYGSNLTLQAGEKFTVDIDPGVSSRMFTVA